MQHDTSAFLRLLLERINALAPNLNIKFGACLDVIKNEARFSSDRTIVYVGIRNIAFFSIRKDFSEVEIQLAFAYKSSEKIVVAAYSLLLSFLHAIHGNLTFHGNALSFNGKSYAVFGRSGAGKSTLTLFALFNGHRLVGDDSVVIQDDHKVTGGRPFLNLTKDTTEALLPNQQCFTRKQYRLLSDLELMPALSEAEPLSGIYLLEKGERIDILACDDIPRALFDMLNSSVLMSTLVKYDASIVDRLLSLLNATKVKRLVFPRSYSKLGETLKALEHDLLI
jgi:hypothetical protein